jgi:hypothetical protein
MAQMTIKQASKFLANTDHPFAPVTIRKAVTEGRLKATRHTVPTDYYLIDESDLMAWASDAKSHRPGRKTD